MSFRGAKHYVPIQAQDGVCGEEQSDSGFATVLVSSDAELVRTAEA
ncbi:MAG: hypothetical protein KME23_15805 [Goleter apudmare HA4340-LM2]|nr:hypothetical protein [Goleter apudmare HA4340-LM2]